MEKAWNNPAEGSVAERIKCYRQAISTWSKEFYINSKKQIVELKAALDLAMSASLPYDGTISSLNQQLLKAYLAEEEYWKKCSRLLWLTLGDRNTCFFHASSKGRKAQNRISVLEDALGSPVFWGEATNCSNLKLFWGKFTSYRSSLMKLLVRPSPPAFPHRLTTAHYHSKPYGD